MCLEEIGYCDHNMATILSPMINVIGEDLYDHLMNTRIFHYDNENSIHMSSKHCEESDYNFNLSSPIILY